MALGNAERAIASLWRIINRLTRLRPETLQRKQNLRDILLTTWSSLVQFLRWEGRYEEAISACEAVRQHLPADQGVDRRIASLVIEQGEVEHGLAQMRQIAEDAPSFASWADLGAEYAALHRYDQAEPCYRSALSLAQSNEEAAVANLGLFRVYRETGRVAEALDAWSMVVVLDPDTNDHVSKVYTWMIERGDLEQATKYVGRERDRARKAFYQGLCHWEAGRQDAARAEWRRVLDMDIEQGGVDGAAWIEAALRLNVPDRALEAEERLIQQTGGIPIDAAIGIGIAHAMLDHLQEAHRWFGQVVQRLKRDWPARDKIDLAKWERLNALVAEPATIRALSDYFETGENGDG
jgi:tetratricopeptide (TPR) repeat protein